MFKISFSKSLENMLNITIQVIADGKIFFKSTVVQNGAFKDENYCIDHLCIVEFLNCCYITR